MRRTAWACFTIILSACSIDRPMLAPPVTPVRATLIDAVRPLLEKSLGGEGWEAQLVDASKRGQTALNRDEEWDESAAWVSFTAHRDGGGPSLLTPRESASVLKGFRSDIRTLVTSLGGEVLDTSENETYRERSLTVLYKLAKVAGTITVKLGPATDRAEETANKLDIAIREQQAR